MMMEEEESFVILVRVGSGRVFILLIAAIGASLLQGTARAHTHSVKKQGNILL